MSIWSLYFLVCTSPVPSPEPSHSREYTLVSFLSLTSCKSSVSYLLQGIGFHTGSSHAPPQDCTPTMPPTRMNNFSTHPPPEYLVYQWGKALDLHSVQYTKNSPPIHPIFPILSPDSIQPPLLLAYFNSATTPQGVIPSILFAAPYTHQINLHSSLATPTKGQLTILPGLTTLSLSRISELSPSMD
jgi:hypothetical protein